MTAPMHVGRGWIFAEKHGESVWKFSHMAKKVMKG